MHSNTTIAPTRNNSAGGGKVAEQTMKNKVDVDVVATPMEETDATNGSDGGG